MRKLILTAVIAVAVCSPTFASESFKVPPQKEIEAAFHKKCGKPGNNLNLGCAEVGIKFWMALNLTPICEPLAPAYRTLGEMQKAADAEKQCAEFRSAGNKALKFFGFPEQQ